MSFAHVFVGCSCLFRLCYNSSSFKQTFSEWYVELQTALDSSSWFSLQADIPRHPPLLGGAPSWKLRVREWEGWHPLFMKWKIKFMFQNRQPAQKLWMVNEETQVFRGFQLMTPQRSLAWLSTWEVSPAAKLGLKFMICAQPMGVAGEKKETPNPQMVYGVYGPNDQSISVRHWASKPLSIAGPACETNGSFRTNGALRHWQRKHG